MPTQTEFIQSVDAARGPRGLPIVLAPMPAPAAADAPWLEYELVARSAPLTERAQSELALVLADALDLIQGAHVPEKAELFQADLARFVQGEKWKVLRSLPFCRSSTGRQDTDEDDREQFSEVIDAIGRAYKLCNELGALPAPKENPKLPAPKTQEATFAEKEFRRVTALASRALQDVAQCAPGSRRHRRAVRLCQKAEFAAWIAMLQEIVQSLSGVAPIAAVDFRRGPCETRQFSAFAGERRRCVENGKAENLAARRKTPYVPPVAKLADPQGDNGRAEYARLSAQSRAKLAAWRAGAK